MESGNFLWILGNNWNQHSLDLFGLIVLTKGYCDIFPAWAKLLMEADRLELSGTGFKDPTRNLPPPTGNLAQSISRR
jgi:hypothetical protein